LGRDGGKLFEIAPIQRLYSIHLQIAVNQNGRDLNANFNQMIENSQYWPGICSRFC